MAEKHPFELRVPESIVGLFNQRCEASGVGLVEPVFSGVRGVYSPVQIQVMQDALGWARENQCDCCADPGTVTVSIDGEEVSAVPLDGPLPENSFITPPVGEYFINSVDDPKPDDPPPYEVISQSVEVKSTP